MTRPIFAAAAALACFLSANELHAESAPQKLLSVEGITEYRLANGLRVLLFPDDSRPKVTVNLTVFVGSRHEGYGETGMAHLLEHMLFKGTPRHPNVPKSLQERGAQFNGTTWLDRTNYYETMPANDENLEFALRLEADRMINSYVKREDLLTEMTVVRNEFERGENSPENILSQRMMAVAFEWHNYGKSTIGNRTDIERVPIDRLQAFYRKFYQPDNAMLVVAGRFNEKKALEYIQKYFSPLLKPTRKLDDTYTEEPAQDGERTVTLRRVGDVGAVGVIYHVPAGPHADFAAVQVLDNILTAPPSGRLYKALVESKKAASVSAFSYALHDPGVIEIMAEVRKDQSLDQARDIMLSILESIGKEGVTEEEVQRAKQQLLKARELAADNTSQIAVQLSEWAAQGDWRLYLLNRDRLEKVTAAQVQEVAKKYLIESNRTVGVFIPTAKPVRTEIPPTKDLAKLFEGYKGRAGSAKGEAFDVAPENVESRVKREVIGKDLKVTLLSKKNRGETVSLRLALRFGDENNLKGLTTACEFLPSLMLKGTKRLTRQQFQDELDKYRATIQGSGNTGVAIFTIETKKPNLEPVLKLLVEALRDAALPEKEFDVMKQSQLASLEQGRSEPQVIAIKTLQRKFAPYSTDDVRYVPTIEEEIDRLKGVQLSQVRDLYENYLSGQHGELTVVGDFDPSTLSLLTDALAKWSTQTPYARIEKAAPTGIAGSKESILTPDKANAIYFAGLVLPMRDDDPDYPALLLGNYILGGGALSSRLGDRLRQKDGLSYGAGSQLTADPKDKRASVMIYAIYNPNNVAKVEAGVREELARILKDGVTADEVAKAKSGFLQQQKVGRTTDPALAQLLATARYADRTMLYHAKLEKEIADLTPDQINAALRKYIDPANVLIVTAGDFKKAPAP